MGNQTTLTGHITFKDGAKVQIKPSGGAYEDIGALSSAISMTIDYDEQVFETANAGNTQKRIRNMKVNGNFNLINIDPDKIALFAPGLFNKEVTAGSAILSAAFTSQVQVGFVANTPQALVPIVTATGRAIKFSAAPVITSVTGSSSGVLTVDDDYVIVVDKEATSGYSIMYIAAGTLTPATDETYTIVFGNNTPIGKTELFAGTTTATLTAYSLKFTHTDDNSFTREVELYSVNSNSGLQFNFGGANEDGVEEFPISFTGELDTSLTDGYQLIRVAKDTGAA